MDPSLSWDRKDSELWMELIAKEGPADRIRTNSGLMPAVGSERVLSVQEALGKKLFRNDVVNIMPSEKYNLSCTIYNLS